MPGFKDRGNVAYQAGDYSAAVDLYTAGIEEEPRNAALFSNRSAAFLNLEDYGKAKRDADTCIELDSKWSKGWWRKGQAQLEDQDYTAARETFTRGLEHCPDDKNLLSGIEKADKYIAALNSIQGPGEAKGEFDPDAPSRRKPNNENSEEKRATEKTDAPNVDEPIWPSTAEQEIQRINQAPNHYAVLHVSTDTSTAEMKKHYYTLARMLHPDKCQLEGAVDAMTSVSQAYDTLSNVLKKTLYDQYLSQTGDDAEHPNQTYQEWESRQQPVDLPVWLRWLLDIKGFGWLFFILLLVIFLPIAIVSLIVFIVLMLIFQIVTAPYRIVMRLCFPDKYKAMKEEQEREMAKLDEAAQDRAFAHV